VLLAKTNLMKAEAVQRKREIEIEGKNITSLFDTEFTQATGGFTFKKQSA